MNRKDGNEFYKPIVRPNTDVHGVTAETIPAGGTGNVIRKLFVTSFHEDYERICDGLLSAFLPQYLGDQLNRLLVLIKKDNTAYIYYDFPLTMQIRTKGAKERGQVVFHNDIIDIASVHFSDDVFDLDVDNGDKLVWLFRADWRFGLYFDLSGQLQKDQFEHELGTYYRTLRYFALYSFLQNREAFDTLIEEGWFPFAQLIGEHFQKLSDYVMEEKKYSFHIDALLKEYDQPRLITITDRWWSNPHFAQKREIIEAGLSAYFQFTKEGYINAIKTISTEIEGILRTAFFKAKGNNPTTSDLKNYVIQCGKAKFSSERSLGFPGLFMVYLDKSVFGSFNLAGNHIPPSRHSIAHGVASLSCYNQVRALQLILTMDQVFFFL